MYPFTNCTQESLGKGNLSVEREKLERLDALHEGSAGSLQLLHPDQLESVASLDPVFGRPPSFQCAILSDCPLKQLKHPALCLAMLILLLLSGGAIRIRTRLRPGLSSSALSS